MSTADKGNYLIILEIKENRNIKIGSLGIIAFEKGWYVYTGSGQRNLGKRMERHLRKYNKKMHWHLDYLCSWAEDMLGLPIISNKNLECDLAWDLEKLGSRGIIGFGSSDCRCKSHLFYFPYPPLQNKDFWVFRHYGGKIAFKNPH